MSVEFQQSSSTAWWSDNTTGTKWHPHLELNWTGQDRKGRQFTTASIPEYYVFSIHSSGSYLSWLVWQLIGLFTDFLARSLKQLHLFLVRNQGIMRFFSHGGWRGVSSTLQREVTLLFYTLPQKKRRFLKVAFLLRKSVYHASFTPMTIWEKMVLGS